MLKQLYLWHSTVVVIIKQIKRKFSVVQLGQGLLKALSCLKETKGNKSPALLLNIQKEKLHVFTLSP